MTLRLTVAIFVVLLVHASQATETPRHGDDGSDITRPAASPRFLVAAAAQDAPPVTLSTLVGNLSSLDYYTRTNAARLIRRTPQAEVVPVLTDAARMNADEFVRYRALVLLTSFGDRGTHDLMASLLRDRNDRLREVAYKWLQRNPDPRLTDTLLAALQSEQAEFVRPALVGALAALDDNAQVQRALLTESMRGLDFFREAVIEALGHQRAEYAVDTIAGIAKLDGPLRQASILALGRIGGTRARAVLTALAANPGDALPVLRAAQCLAGDACDAHIKALGAAAAGAQNAASARTSIAALAAIAAGGGAASSSATTGPASRLDTARADTVSGFSRVSVAAVESLIGLASRDGPVRDQAALEFSTVALRRPDAVVAWLDGVSEANRTSAIALLKDGFERLEEEFAEEQFYAAARAAYWKAAEGSSTRDLSAAIIQRLEF